MRLGVCIYLHHMSFMVMTVIFYDIFLAQHINIQGKGGSGHLSTIFGMEDYYIWVFLFYGRDILSGRHGNLKEEGLEEGGIRCICFIVDWDAHIADGREFLACRGMSTLVGRG